MRPSDEGNAPAAGVDEVQGGFLGSLVAVGRYRREHVRQACTREEYERYAHVVYLDEVRIVDGVLRQAGYYAHYVHAGEVVYGLFLTQMVFMAVGRNDGISGFRGIVLYAVEHGGVVVGHEVGHYDAYHVGRFPS